ncbi:MAG TPA: glycogen debranching protein GlgX, partial [Allosphingosinicella sp.]
ERTGNVFHGHVAGVTPGARYGLRAHGPFAPAEGQRFNAAKLLVEPYARLLDRPFRLHPSMLPYPEGADDLAFDASDSAPHMPKAIVLPPNAPLSGHAPLAAWADTVVYELHVKGFTKRHPDVRAEAQGTFAGLSHPAAIEHLVKLGITTVELMPTAAWIEERHLVSLGLSNYWGYNPVALMAPEPRLAPGGWDEVRRTVAALADAGIETVVDVVLNHSGEGDALGPTLSLRGLDNATYYRLHPDDPRRYIDDSGCGNTLALHRAPVVRLVMDSLRTWVREAEIHGFRFDLAACMGRRPDGFDPEAPLLAALEQDPELRHLKLIAEPWDIGPGGYQVGKFPPGWGEWNDRFRDDARRFWRGDHHQLGPLATRLAGSADLFGRHRPPSRSVNFLTAHDGFALADLVAHETKKNEENGEQNRDGSNANYSWNSGCEGETEDAAILAYRTRDQRALLATLLLARGTPMLSMGAELGHSQRGNNNCYAQDNEISWLDWSRADRSLVAFTAKLVALRRAHPLLRRDRVLDGEAGAEGLADVEWVSPEGKPMAPGDWDTPEAGSLTMVLGGGGERMAVLIHRGRDSRAFTLPPPRPGHDWHLLLDSGGGREASRVEGALEIGPRSVALLAETASGDGSGGGGSDAVDRLAEAAGIQPTWWTVDGSRHDVTEDTKRHLLAAIRLPAGSDAEARDSLARLAEQRDLRPLPPVLAGREAEPIAVQLASERGLRRPVWLSVEGPEGEVARVLASPASAAFRRSRAADGRAFERSEVHLPSLAPGRYTIRRDDSPDVACRLTVAPKQAWLPESVRSGRKLFGIAAQLYSLRRPGDQGIGDFTALAELAARSAAAGAAAVGINPLHAMFQGERERASPYQPSDRRFLDPIYLDLEALRGLPGGEAIGAVPAVGTDLIDYTSVWAVKDTALRLLFAGFQPHELDGFTAEGGEALRTFATYCAIARRHGERWPDWPSALRDPASADVA